MQPKNPNLFRRRWPALTLALAYPWLRLFLLLVRRPRVNGSDAVTVFQSYQVGDFYMALPAIRHLAERISIRVLCRPDCVFVLRKLGIEAIPFPNPFPVEPGLGTFLSGIKHALALRSQLGAIALDFHADPRTAFLLKAAGASQVYSFLRPFGWFIDHAFPITTERRHQSEMDMAVAEKFLASGAGKSIQGVTHPDNRQAPRPKGRTGLMVSCWTRRDEKNWPLDSWNELIAMLLREGRDLCVIVPPDGDQNFHNFRSKWQAKVEFLAAGLEVIHTRVEAAEGVLCTDNFLGHLGANLGKPVFWINGSSDVDHVRPYGPSVEIVQMEPMPCRPCQHCCINPIHKQCLVELRPNTVAVRAKLWLERNGLRYRPDT